MVVQVLSVFAHSITKVFAPVSCQILGRIEIRPFAYNFTRAREQMFEEPLEAEGDFIEVLVSFKTSCIV